MRIRGFSCNLSFSNGVSRLFAHASDTLWTQRHKVVRALVLTLNSNLNRVCASNEHIPWTSVV